MPLPRLILALALSLGLAAPAPAAARLTVFGAASLTDVLQDIGASYSKKTGTAVEFSFASSSTLARQIEAGAPADVVALANTEWVKYLDKRHLILPGSLIEPVGGQLVIVAPKGSGITLSDPPAAGEILVILGKAGRIAIGDPAHVPAGIYARESLTNLGLWPALEKRFAYADNVRAALALVAHGEAPLGIVYATDARAEPAVEEVGFLPDSSHAPITYAFAAVAGGKAGGAKDFLAYLAGPDGLAAFERYGFTRR